MSLSISIWRGILTGCLLAGAMAGAGCRPLPPRFSNVGAFVEAPAEPPPMVPVTMSNQFDPGWLEPPADLFKLGPGDRVEIELLGEPASRATTLVAPDGKIYFNLLPGVDVWGLTLAQAKARLEQEFARYVRQNPQVSLVLREVQSQRIWLLGRVQAPGVYALAVPTTLLEAIAQAGGTMSLTSYRDQAAAGINEELADLRHSFILRQGRLLPVDFARLLKQGDLSQNIYLQPDDFVYIPATAAREVFVLGAVAAPRPVPYHQGMTVANAVASAYGTIDGAYLQQVAVVRGSLTKPELAMVDYRNVIRGATQDIPLLPGDIVYVPYSPYRYVTRYLETILNTFVSSTAINAGSRAVGTSSIGGAGVFIPVGGGAQVAH